MTLDVASDVAVREPFRAGPPGGYLPAHREYHLEVIADDSATGGRLQITYLWE